MATLLDRRGLLKLLGCGGCALALPSLSGCTIAEVFGGGSATVPFDLADPRFVPLKSVGGVATVDAAGRNLLLIRTDAQTVVALSRICTHTACDMAPDRFGTFDGTKLICRCHNSHFSTTGEVLQGPATRDLTSYTVDFDATAGTGTVQIGGAPPEPVGPDVPEPFKGRSNPLDVDDPDVIAAGKALYEGNDTVPCTTCHGAEGVGNPALVPPGSAFNVDQTGMPDDYMFWRIRTGNVGGPMGSTMFAYGEAALSDTEVWQIVSYLRSLQP